MSENRASKPIILWFRQDLRLTDNPALCYAADSGKPVIFCYIHDEVSESVRPMGSAQKWWLHHSLLSLSKSLQEFGGQLILRSGPAADVIARLVSETAADEICWNRRYGEGEQAVDRFIKEDFPGTAKSFGGMLLHEPSLVRTGSGKPYKVYTPFWKNLSSQSTPRQPLPKPESIHASTQVLKGDELASWALLPTVPNWAHGIAETWQPGESSAALAMNQFIKKHIQTYDSNRDLPGPDQTSRLSPHLRFGEISPYQLWHASYSGTARNDRNSERAREIWRKELVWREFSYHLLQEWPSLATSNFNSSFDRFPWTEDHHNITAWQKGMTGYPIVDAGMRQLYQTGWMHNRVRMIVGSFLVKHLMIDWRVGERWFWDTLVDGDPAANPAQWQWVAGTGADAAPYFRIFNPILQASKFDPDGIYIKKYVPELNKLPARYLPAPWQAPDSELAKAGVKLGNTYPKPIVDHQFARNRALDALQSLKSDHQ
ncbi:MAG: cryptochrome/photolyase family protein [Rhizobiaceae bacterium]